MHHQLELDRDHYPLVYVISEMVYGVATHVNLGWSKVRYVVGGIEHNVILEDDEFIFRDENTNEQEEG